MAKFKFDLFQRVSDVMRTKFSIEAGSLEEAKLKAIEFYKNHGTADLPWKKTKGDTALLSLDQNFGISTVHMYIRKTEDCFFENGEAFDHRKKDEILKKFVKKLYKETFPEEHETRTN